MRKTYRTRDVRKIYRLSWLGQRLQNALMALLPDQFCNIYVIIARKPA